MSGFSADWLQLREPFDRAARAAAAAALDLPAWQRAWRTAEGRLSVIDLACGTGANLRELAPRLGGEQRWLLVDHDPALLAALIPALADWAQAQGHRLEECGGALLVQGTGADGRPFAAELRCERRDLARDLAALPFGNTQLVTASALLDLVSADWLQALLRRATAARCALLFALNVDGRTAWEPPAAGDAVVDAAFKAHQARDKGFLGAALGAAAVAEAMHALRAAGYRCTQAASDWLVDASRSGPHGRAAAALQAAMVAGMAEAAQEQAPGEAATIEAWRQRRLAWLDGSRLRVGHLDLIASP